MLAATGNWGLAAVSGAWPRCGWAGGAAVRAGLEASGRNAVVAWAGRVRGVVELGAHGDWKRPGGGDLGGSRGSG